MTAVLALDTSTLTASVALTGGPRADQLVDRAVGSHSDDLMGLIDEVLSRGGLTVAELDAVAVGAGPGSFTGLRIGMATAKGLCFASGKPLWTASSLAALALDAGEALPDEPAAQGRALVVPVLDARRDEVFAGFYRIDAAGGRAEEIAPDAVLSPAALASRVATALADAGLSTAVLIGDALAVHGDALAEIGRGLRGAAFRATPSARSVARLVTSGSRDDALRSGTPVYIRPSEAEVVFPNGNPGGRFTGSGSGPAPG